MGDIEALAKSILHTGQIQPVVLTDSMELVAGGRRLAAALYIQNNLDNSFELGYIVKSDISNYQYRLIELMENLERKSFSPAEECLAIAELHELKVKHEGKARPGVIGGWTLADTGKLIGKTSMSVMRDIETAYIVRQIPELSSCETKKDINLFAESIRKRVQINSDMKVYLRSNILDDVDKLVSCEDALDAMIKIEANSIDILCTDPPYGISLSDMKKNPTLINVSSLYHDNPDYVFILYKELAIQSFRFCKDTSHAAVFLAIQHFSTIAEFFTIAGWQVCRKPMLWVKDGGQAQCNMPAYWPASSYEAILYARKAESTLVRQGQLDTLLHKPVPTSFKIHAVERPVSLMRDILSRMGNPGHVVYDPFAGSFATAEAALREKMIIRCNEINPMSVQQGKARMIRVIEDMKNAK